MNRIIAFINYDTPACIFQQLSNQFSICPLSHRWSSIIATYLTFWIRSHMCPESSSSVDLCSLAMTAVCVRRVVNSFDFNSIRRCVHAHPMRKHVHIYDIGAKSAIWFLHCELPVGETMCENDSYFSRDMIQTYSFHKSHSCALRTVFLVKDHIHIWQHYTLPLDLAMKPVLNRIRRRIWT